MRTTYYHYIDGSVGIGTTYHTLATGTVNEFGIGISSHIGIGTVNNVHAPFAIHHDGPASESNRTGGIEIVGNSNASGDKHGARILAYNRVFSDKGFRRLRFQASEYQFETPSDNGTSTNNADPAVGITSLGNVGIGTTNTIDTYDGGFERRLVVYGGGAQVGSAYTWTGGDFYHAEDIITAVTKTKSGGFAINCREQEVSATDPSRPIWTLRSYTNEPIAFGQGIYEIARFNEDGNLGIGTTTSTSPLTLFKQDPQYVGVTTVLTLKTFRADMTVGNPAGGSIKFDNYDGNYGHEAFIEVIAPNSYSTNNEASREKTADFNFKQTNNGTLNTRFTIKGETGNIVPGADNTQDLGSSSLRWANVYTGDMHLNNMNTGGNEVDGSEGHWTLQEGSDDLFLINRNTGKKYKFNLTEVS